MADSTTSLLLSSTTTSFAEATTTALLAQSNGAETTSAPDHTTTMATDDDDWLWISDSRMTAWGFVTIIVMIMAAGGNFVAFYSAAFSSRLKESFHLLIGNVSLVYTIICFPIYLVYASTQLRHPRDIPTSTCNFLVFFVNVARSVLHLTYAGLAYDQLISLRSPATYERTMSPRRVHVAIGVIYAAALFVEMWAAIGHSADYGVHMENCSVLAPHWLWSFSWHLLFIVGPLLFIVYCCVGIVMNMSGGSSSDSLDLTPNGDVPPSRTASTSALRTDIVTPRGETSHRNRRQLAVFVLVMLVLYLVFYVAGTMLKTMTTGSDREAAAWGFWLSWAMAMFHPLLWPLISAEVRSAYVESCVDIKVKSSQGAKTIRRAVPTKLRAAAALTEAARRGSKKSEHLPTGIPPQEANQLPPTNPPPRSTQPEEVTDSPRNSTTQLKQVARTIPTPRVEDMSLVPHIGPGSGTPDESRAPRVDGMGNPPAAAAATTQRPEEPAAEKRL